MANNRFTSLGDGGASSAHQGPTSAPAPSAPAPSAAGAAGAADSTATAKPGRAPRKRKGHRGGKKKRSRRKSFALLHGDSHDDTDRTSSAGGFYNHPRGNLSGASIDSEILLDHRYAAAYLTLFFSNTQYRLTTLPTENTHRCAFDAPPPFPPSDSKTRFPAPAAAFALSRHNTVAKDLGLRRLGTRLLLFWAPLVLPAMAAPIEAPTEARVGGHPRSLPVPSPPQPLVARTRMM